MSNHASVSRILLVLAIVSACAAAPLLAQEPEELTPSDQAYLLWREGTLFHMLGQYRGAMERFQKSIEIHPTAEGHTYLGWSLSGLGRLDEAIVECKKAIPLDPDYGNPYNDIGVYLIDLGRPDEAIPWLKKAMRAKRYCCYQFAHFNMGRILLMNNKTVEAERSFERALSYDPNYLPALGALEYIRRQGLQSL